MEITNQEIISNLLTTDGKGRVEKREQLILLLNRIKEFGDEKDDMYFYLDMVIGEAAAYSGRK